MKNIFLMNESDSVADTLNMCVDCDMRLTEPVCKNNICGFPADSRKFHEFLHGIWYDSVIIRYEFLGHRNEVLRLIAIESDALYVFSNRSNICLRHRKRVWKFFKKFRCYDIYTFIRSLRREHRRCQKLKYICVIECASCVRIRSVQGV